MQIQVREREDGNMVNLIVYYSRKGQNDHTLSD